jgi:antitoxin (DNA-binding transcriptional repressor) of toxin-antitoxin stability system
VSALADTSVLVNYLRGVPSARELLRSALQREEVVAASVLTRIELSIGMRPAERRATDVLGTVRYQGQRYVVERNGTPMAALVPLTDLPESSGGDERPGFLALVGAFEDAPEYAESLAEVVRTRGAQRSRPAPRL